MFCSCFIWGVNIFSLLPLFKIDDLSFKPSACPQVMPGIYFLLILLYNNYLIRFIFLFKFLSLHIGFVLQAQSHPVKSMTTPPFLSFRLFPTRSPRPRSEGTSTRRTTSISTTCPGALKSSRRRPNHPDGIWRRDISFWTFSCHTRHHCTLSVFTYTLFSVLLVEV